MANIPVLNRMLQKFSFRRKHNRSALNIQAVDLLRAEIEAQGITQKKIAEQLEISQAALSKTLSICDKNLELNTIADIATALNKRFVLELTDDRHAVTVLVSNKHIVQNSLQQQNSIRQIVQFKELDMQIIDSSVLTHQTATS